MNKTIKIAHEEMFLHKPKKRAKVFQKKADKVNIKQETRMAQRGDRDRIRIMIQFIRKAV